MTDRLTAPLTLAVTALVVLVMAIWGFNALTAPIDTKGSSTDETSACTGARGKATFLTRDQVTVSVYNAGKRSGRAGDAMDLLEAVGFRAGAVGNAPKGSRVQKVKVMSTSKDHPDATLVARAFGKKVPVLVVEDDLGPGVDVIIGDKFNRLVPDSIKRIKVADAPDGC